MADCNWPVFEKLLRLFRSIKLTGKLWSSREVLSYFILHSKVEQQILFIEHVSKIKKPLWWTHGPKLSIEWSMLWNGTVLSGKWFNLRKKFFVGSYSSTSRLLNLSVVSFVRFCKKFIFLHTSTYMLFIQRMHQFVIFYIRLIFWKLILWHLKVCIRSIQW